MLKAQVEKEMAEIARLPPQDLELHSELWTMANGTTVKVKDMTLSHVRNALGCLEKRFNEILISSNSMNTVSFKAKWDKMGDFEAREALNDLLAHQRTSLEQNKQFLFDYKRKLEAHSVTEADRAVLLPEPTEESFKHHVALWAAIPK